MTELIIEQNKITNYGYVNTYGDGSGTGIYVEKVGNLTEILNNEIENTANNANATNSYFRGIGLYESDAKISGNTISGANYGIEITGSNLPINTPQITNNTIEETKRGIHIGSNNLAPVINYNNLADNTEFGIYNNGDQEIDAKSNWWGEIATDEMDAGGNPKNITYIYDQYDDNSKGEVIYAWWPTASTVIETEDVAAGQNELTFEETNTFYQ
ncbi:MAG: right-handed parallel beta-helix repeat-containing protein [Ignavibacteriales bacterium]|nr:right-handed parallel beta-helix repeat-containing protein [Ignavibacteriales bacterium]